MRKEKILDSAMSGTPVIALCGKVWVPGRDPNKFPVCPQCKGVPEGLREPQDGDWGGCGWRWRPTLGWVRSRQGVGRLLRREVSALRQPASSAASHASSSAASQLPPAFPARAPWGTAGKLRAWQAEALELYESRPGRDFLTIATPGAGKTTFALAGGHRAG